MIKYVEIVWQRHRGPLRWTQLLYRDMPGLTCLGVSSNMQGCVWYRSPLSLYPPSCELTLLTFINLRRESVRGNQSTLNCSSSKLSSDTAIIEGFQWHASSDFIQTCSLWVTKASWRLGVIRCTLVRSSGHSIIRYAWHYKIKPRSSKCIRKRQNMGHH